MHEASPGEQIYLGQRPLVARIAGHEHSLPAEASRCVNCHRAAAPAAQGSAALSDTQAFGPPLTPALLTEPARRRGGPPSRYELASFCRLLRTGVDPAYVIIPSAMPRFEISIPDCAALWTYLSQARQ